MWKFNINIKTSGVRKDSLIELEDALKIFFSDLFMYIRVKLEIYTRRKTYIDIGLRRQICRFYDLHQQKGRFYV